MKRRIITSFLIFVLTLSVAAIIPVHAELYDGWTYQIDVTIDHTKIDAELTDFPIYLEISDSSGITDTDLTPIFDEIGNNYTQLLVTTEDLTSCYTEVVSWDNSTEYAELWIKVPYISNETDTQLRVYYGADHNPNNLYIGLTGSNNAENVWVNGYVMVQHMNDATTSSVMDSSSNDNDGTKTAANEPIVSTSGKIGEGQLFDATNDYIKIADSPSLDSFNITGQFTVELWFKAATIPNGNWFIQCRTGAFAITAITNGRPIFYLYDSLGANCYRYGATNYADNQWHYIVSQCDGTQFPTVYIDNVLIVGTTGGAGDGRTGLLSNSGLLDIGGRDDAPNYTVNGILDECRASSVARSSAWVGASYQTQNDSLLTVGAPITEPPTPTSGLVLFGFLGFIIAICALALVMANKKR